MEAILGFDRFLAVQPDFIVMQVKSRLLGRSVEVVPFRLLLAKAYIKRRDDTNVSHDSVVDNYVTSQLKRKNC